MHIFAATAFTALALPAVGNAQVLELSTWPVIPHIYAAQVGDVETAAVAAKPDVAEQNVQETAAVVEQAAQVVETARPPVPCNPFDAACLGYPPGTVIIPAPRPGVPCNPYRYEDPCNGYPPLPPGAVIVSPPRPGIPCTIYTLRHCAPGQVPA